MQVGFDEGAAGVLLGLVALGGMGAVMIWPTRLWIGWALIAVAIAGFMLWGAVVSGLWEMRTIPKIGMILSAATLIGCAAWYFWPTTIPNEISASTARTGADVTLALVNPESPSFLLVNKSNKTASQIKISVVLWNLDDPRIYMEGNKAPDAHDPLLIPVQTFDFLRPHTAGMVSIFNTPIVSPYVKRGQRLVGSAGVVCPECERGHSYHLYINYGQDGWIAEIPEKKEGELMAPLFFRKPIIIEFFNRVMKTPETERLPVLSDPSAIGPLDEPSPSPAR